MLNLAFSFIIISFSLIHTDNVTLILIFRIVQALKEALDVLNCHNMLDASQVTGLRQGLKMYIYYKCF